MRSQFIFVLLLLIECVRCSNAPRVIIVGAGAAGIAAASRLLENNITDIIILEAEGRIGGRIHSVEFGDLVVDLGAEWCVGEKNNAVYELVKDLDLLERDADFGFTLYDSSREEVDQAFFHELSNILDGIYNEEKQGEEINLGEYMLKRYNETVTEKYGNDSKKLLLASAVLRFTSKTILADQGAFSWFDVAATRDYEKCEGSNLNWKGRGYKTILDVLMKKYPDSDQELPLNSKIMLNKEVVKITWDKSIENPEGVTIKCHDGSRHTADHVISTVSLGVLKNRYENLFHPKLPKEKINAIETLGIEAVMKVFFHFPIKWWAKSHFTDFSFGWSDADSSLLLQQFPDGPKKNGQSWLTDLTGLYTINENPNVLQAWFIGEFVPDIELLSDDMIVNGTMFVLNKFIGHLYHNITKPDAIVRYNWYSNDHFRGTYSFQTVKSREKGISQEYVLSQPLNSSVGKQTVFFAGEATHPIYYAAVHGAIETGWREADRIIKLYK